MRPRRTTTIRSVSLDTDIAVWIEQQALQENRSVSNYVNTLLGRLRARAARELRATASESRKSDHPAPEGPVPLEERAPAGVTDAPPPITAPNP